MMTLRALEALTEEVRSLTPQNAFESGYLRREAKADEDDDDVDERVVERRRKRREEREANSEARGAHQRLLREPRLRPRPRQRIARFEQPVLSASILSKSLVASLKTQRICRAIFEVFTQQNRMVVFVDCENGLQKRFEFDLGTMAKVKLHTRCGRSAARLGPCDPRKSRRRPRSRRAGFALVCMAKGAAGGAPCCSCQIPSGWSHCSWHLFWHCPWHLS